MCVCVCVCLYVCLLKLLFSHGMDTAAFYQEQSGGTEGDDLGPLV